MTKLSETDTLVKLKLVFENSRMYVSSRTITLRSTFGKPVNMQGILVSCDFKHAAKGFPPIENLNLRCDLVTSIILNGGVEFRFPRGHTEFQLLFKMTVILWMNICTSHSDLNGLLTGMFWLLG